MDYDRITADLELLQMVERRANFLAREAGEFMYTVGIAKEGGEKYIVIYNRRNRINALRALRRYLKLRASFTDDDAKDLSKAIRRHAKLEQ